jgi:hypothetical protein
VNVSTDLLFEVPQPFIIKTAHGSGGIVKVSNETYQCVKSCQNWGMSNGLISLTTDSRRELDKAFGQLHSRMLSKKNFYTRSNMQPQYQFIPRSIIVEEDILTNNPDMSRDVTYWYTVNGIVLFVSYQCDQNDKVNGLGSLESKRRFYTADFRPLDMKYRADICPPSQSVHKPQTWEIQRRIAESLGETLPLGMTRIDLYGGEKDVYFSEFTFTSSMCNTDFKTG